MSDDEFDIVDDLANLEGVDWDAILATRPPPSPNSSHYSFDELDQQAFAQVDTLERNSQAIAVDTHAVIPSSSLSSPQSNPIPTVHSSRFFRDLNGPDKLLQGSTKRKAGDDLNLRASSKKQRSAPSPLEFHLPSKKGKEKENEDLRQVLSKYEDEFICPICCDIFVAPHLGNPCGHSFCGDCGWQWSRMKNNDTCAICRTKLSKKMPMIPNITLDNTVEKHIQALGTSGDEDWILGGAKHEEWNFRKEKWKKDVAARTRKEAKGKGKRKVVEVVDIMDDLMYMIVPDDENDGDYEEVEEDAAVNALGDEFLEAMRRSTRTRV